MVLEGLVFSRKPPPRTHHESGVDQEALVDKCVIEHSDARVTDSCSHKAVEMAWGIGASSSSLCDYVLAR